MSAHTPRKHWKNAAYIKNLAITVGPSVEAMARADSNSHMPSCGCSHNCEATTSEGDRIDYCPLHAAAPELLEALADLLDLGRAGYITGDDIAVTRAVEYGYAALAKAKGDKS